MYFYGGTRTRAEAAYFKLMEDWSRRLVFEIWTQRHIHRQFVDFLFLGSERRGIVEIDGPEHSIESDRHRDQWFKQFGFDVLRITNDSIFNRPVSCVERTLEWWKQLPRLSSIDVDAFDKKYQQWLLECGYHFKDGGLRASVWVNRVRLLEHSREQDTLWSIFDRYHKRQKGYLSREACGQAHKELLNELNENVEESSAAQIEQRFVKLVKEKKATFFKNLRKLDAARR